jgi:K+-sensing histidine kinase KdpD
MLGQTLGDQKRNTRWHYAQAAVFTALAVLARWLLDPLLGDLFPLRTLYAAVALAAWRGGYRPALLAALLGYLACNWFFIEPRGQFAIESNRDWWGVIAYVFLCAIIIGLGEAIHSANRRLAFEIRIMELWLKDRSRYDEAMQKLHKQAQSVAQQEIP